MKIKYFDHLTPRSVGDQSQNPRFAGEARKAVAAYDGYALLRTSRKRLPRSAWTRQVRWWSLSRRRWRGAVEKFAEWVRGHYGGGVVIIFGSRARNESYAASDTDLLVILDRSDLDTLSDLLREAYRVGIPNPEIHLFSLDEALREAKGEHCHHGRGSRRYSVPRYLWNHGGAEEEHPRFREGERTCQEERWVVAIRISGEN